MKCKKIFAMLLALCMVLSTFVAVSAADVVVVDIYEDYEDGIGETICGGDITIATEDFEGENVLVATNSASGAAGWQNLVGFAVTDTEGNHLTQQALPAEGVIEYSFDIYVPAEGGNVGDATFYLRTSNGFPPAGMQTGLNELNGLTTGTWQTFSGTKNVGACNWAGDDTNDLPVWICLRPNFSGAGEFYLDNVSFTITVPGEEDEEPELPPVTGGIEFDLAPKNVAGTLEDGVYTVTEAQLREYAGSTTNYDNCSAQDWLKIIPTTELDAEKTIKVSFDIELENLYNSVGAAYADRYVRLRIRDAQNGSVVPYTTYQTTVAANTGSAQPVEFEIPVASIAGYDHFGVNVDMQGPLASSHGENEYFEISNVSIAYVGEDEPELPPVTPEEPDEPEVPEEAIFTTEIPNGNSVTTEADGVYTVTVADVYNNMTAGATNSYNGYVAIIPATPIALDEDWTVTYDLTTNGLTPGSADIWLRLLDNTATAAQGRTLGYVKQSATKADGTVTYTFTSEDIENGGGTSSATEIAAIYITFNMAPERAAYEEAPFDGYIEFSNISFEYGLPESEEPDEPVVPPVTPDEPEEPSEPGEIEYFNVIEINAPLDDASEITMVGQNVTVENATDIGGRSNVVKASGVGDSNNSIVGLKIGGSDFAFQPGDKIRYSVDVYTENSTTPGLWLRRHTGDMEPFNSNFKPALGTWEANTWRTITHECAFENLGTYDVAKAPQGWATPGDYALYLRANLGTVYLDNFSITVEREFVATIESVELVEAGADNATFRVTADGAIDIDTIAATIDGVEVDVTAEVEDELNTLVTVTGLAPNTEYTFAVTGAMNPNDRDVAVADEAACTVNFTTIAEVDAEAGLARDTFTYTLTNNLSETETIHVVLLRCKGNTVVDTISVPVEAESGEPVEGSIEVPELGSGEYYRFFAWTYENDMINSMANLIDLD